MGLLLATDAAATPGHGPPTPPPYEAPPPPASVPSRWALWAGLRGGYDWPVGPAFDGVGRGDRPESYLERHFWGAGPAVEVDFGMRVGRRMYPFFFVEHAFVRQGTVVGTPRPLTSAAIEVSDDPLVLEQASFNRVGFAFRSVFGSRDIGLALELGLSARFARAVFQDGTVISATSFGGLRLGIGMDVRIASINIMPMALAQVANYGEVMVQYPGDKERNAATNVGTHARLLLQVGIGFDLLPLM